MLLIKILVSASLALAIAQSSRDHYEMMDFGEIAELDNSFYGEPEPEPEPKPKVPVIEKTEKKTEKKEERSFLQEYAEAISATIALLVFIISLVILAIRVWRLRRNGADWGTIFQFCLEALPQVPVLHRNRRRFPGAIPVQA